MAQAQDTPVACSVPAKLDDGWTLATPSEAGLDPDKLCSLERFIGRSPSAHIDGVVVVRHGRLVLERYYKGANYRLNSTETVEFGPAVKHDLQSISKSVTSLLVGIARGEGKFPGLDAPIIDHLPATYADLRTADKARITVRDLLTMASGLDWDERTLYGDPGNSARQMILSPDMSRFVLQRPVAFKPGENYNYSSGDTELLGAMLAYGVDRPIDDYARDKLFGPLGITDFEWLKAANSGQPIASAGLRLRPRDLAKLGQLVLADGQWNGKQVMPKGWAAESTKQHIRGMGHGYGYQWWLGRSMVNGRDLPWIAGYGFGGQRLYVQPDTGLVVVVTASEYAIPIRQQGILSLDILAGHVLAAVTGN